jgi:glycosyltransferase involved in cell wall biosynthesis
MTVRQMSPGRFLREFALRDSRIRLFDAERCGLSRCLNRAIGLAQGKYLARMDADDVALPGRFQAQIDYLDANPEVLALGGQARLVSPEGWPLCQWTVPTGHEEIDAAHMAGLPGQLIHPTSMMRLDAVRSIGGLNEQWTYAQDYDLWLRLAEKAFQSARDRPELSSAPLQRHVRDAAEPVRECGRNCEVGEGQARNPAS